MDFIDILDKWIYAYGNRHNYIIFEIDYNRKLVFYYIEGKNMFEEYTNFNYTKVDLFN